jgi:hypothetical protein
VLTLSTSGEGAKSLLRRVHLSTHQSLLHCTLSLAIHFNGSNGTAYTRPSKIQNSIFHRSCNILRFFQCMWFAFVLMLTIFHHPRAKTFCLVSYLAKKKTLARWPASFFFSQVSSANKTFLPEDDEKSSASAQKQATHTGKISGRCNFCGGCNYII